MTLAIIGSGVAGISAACALINRGYFVTFLDVGERTEYSVVERSDTAVGNEKRLTSNEHVLHSGRLPEKLHFGSDYIYGSDRPFALKAVSNAPYPTFAQGGFQT